MKISNISKLIIAVAASELAGVIGSIFTLPSIPTWYAGLAKPAFTPPAWIFGPVWIVLFALMGIAVFLVWCKGLDRKDAQVALAIFAGQLILNVLWSIIFFSFYDTGAAFVEIVILWLTILATIVSFSRISSTAAWLLVPYILWVTFAGFLNFSIWQLSINTSGKSGAASEISLPVGYTLDFYSVEKISDISCIRNSDCQTPGEYLMRSNCPFTSLCLKNKCAVVCPSHNNR
jgi:translocator protein